MPQRGDLFICNMVDEEEEQGNIEEASVIFWTAETKKKQNVNIRNFPNYHQKVS